jgi:hypothetical protein
MQYAEFRSLCFHRAAAEVLSRDPEPAVNRARRHLTRLHRLHPHARELLGQWDKWLECPPDELMARILDPGLAAREMRHVSPLVGLLSPRERVRALKQARAEYRW